MASFEEDRLKKALVGVYHEKERTDAGDLWQQQVMRHVRQLGHPGAKANNSILLTRFLWRFAPVATVLILVLSVCLVELDVVSEWKMAEMLIDDSSEFDLVQFFVI